MVSGVTFLENKETGKFRIVHIIDIRNHTSVWKGWGCELYDYIPTDNVSMGQVIRDYFQRGAWTTTHLAITKTQIDIVVDAYYNIFKKSCPFHGSIDRSFEQWLYKNRLPKLKPEPTPESRFPCPSCKAMFVTQGGLDYHRKLYQHGFPCQACNLDFQTQYQLERHTTSRKNPCTGRK